MALKSKGSQKNNQQIFKILLLSGALNIILLAFLAYTTLSERPPVPYYVLKPAEERKNIAQVDAHTNEEAILKFREMSLDQLISKLKNIQSAENGYTQRDLALGCLTSFHHFNLSRALLGYPSPQQQKTLAFTNTQKRKIEEVTLYPGLTEPQFQAIIQYATVERWPFTSEGLLHLLQASEFQNEASLQEAFSLTPEFVAVETLFSRADVPVSKKELLMILKEGDWNMLHNFSEEQKMSHDLSAMRRQRFLQDYITHQSSSAAYTLLKIDHDYASKKMDDQSVVTMLKVLTTKTPEAEKFAMEMLSSPRGDAVWQQASLRLFEFAGEVPPAVHNRTQALTQFSSQTMPKALPNKTKQNVLIGDTAKKVPMKQPEPITLARTSTVQKVNTPSQKAAPKKKEIVYVVQNGDSLWKISKRFKVDVETIKKQNQLTSDFLKPGAQLRIPA